MCVFRKFKARDAENYTLRPLARRLAGGTRGVLAQLVERLLCKQNVRGSSPLFSIGAKRLITE